MVEVTACPVCGGTDLVPCTGSAPERRFLHHSQSRCRGCALLVAQPRATHEDIARYYREDYYSAQWPDAEGAFRSNTASYTRYEWPLLRSLWVRWPPRRGGKALEVGCGYGAMLPLLSQEGYAASGCDPSADAVRYCGSRGFDVVQGGVPGAPVSPPYVLTLSQHVIEHVEDPRGFVAALVSLTERGGVVAVVTEDAWNTQWALERALARATGRRPAFHTSRDHTFVFSARHLDRLLRDAGCDEVHTRAFSYVPKESLHWKAYKGALRTMDRLRGHGDFLMAVGRVRA